MSKSDPPQVQTDALRSDDDPENFADLAAEESINDPVSSAMKFNKNLIHSVPRIVALITVCANTGARAYVSFYATQAFLRLCVHFS